MCSLGELEQNNIEHASTSLKNCLNNKLDVPSLCIREKSEKKLKKRLCSLKCHGRRELPEHPECCKEVGKLMIAVIFNLTFFEKCIHYWCLLIGQSSGSNMSLYRKENRSPPMWMDMLSMLLRFSTLRGIFHP